VAQVDVRPHQAMRVKILGSALGRLPAMELRLRELPRLRDCTLRGRARTQTQIAFSPDPDAKSGFLFRESGFAHPNTPTPELSRSRKSENALAIAGVFLPSADVDSVMVFLHLREFQSFFVFAAQLRNVF